MSNQAALVLGGGGANGSFQAAVVQTLEGLGWSWTSVDGTSVGALNGAKVAAEKTPELHALWYGIKGNSDIYKPRSAVSLGWRFLKRKLGLGGSDVGLASAKPLESLVERELWGDLHVLPANVFWVDMQSGRLEFGPPTPSNVLRSSRLPGWELYDGSTDGGIRETIPLGNAVKRESTRAVIVVMCSPIEPEPAPLPKNELEYVGRLVAIAGNEIAQNDIQSVVRLNNIVKWTEEFKVPSPRSESGRAYKYVPIAVIAPEHSLGSGTDFSPAEIRRKWKLGEQAAVKWHQNPVQQ